MTLLKKAALPFLLSIGVVAPSAHALTVTSPLTAAPSTITNAGTTLSFKSFSSANFVLPPNATLQNVFLTVKGTTGGSTSALNYAPSASAFDSTGNFGLTANGLTNASTTGTATTVVPCGGVACAGGNPPGAASSSITPTVKTFFWSVFGGGFDFTSPNTLSLSVLSSFSPTFTPGGPFKSADASTFAVSPNLAETFLTYDYYIPSGVPGPLPIVGGMTAFAFSRRLRRRISSAAL